jgi:hypothetical protein
MSEASTSNSKDGVMASDKPVASFADALRKEGDNAFEDAHKKEAGVTTVPKSGKSGHSAHNMHSNGVSGKQGSWSWEGLPYKGAPGDFKHNDPDHMKPQLKHAAKVKQFNLNEEDDMDEYNKVVQKAFDGLVIISYEEKKYDKDIKSWRILLRWAEPYFAAPPTLQE